MHTSLPREAPAVSALVEAPTHQPGVHEFFIELSQEDEAVLTADAEGIAELKLEEEAESPAKTELAV
jgi:hypothetical protein